MRAEEERCHVGAGVEVFLPQIVADGKVGGAEYRLGISCGGTVHSIRACMSSEKHVEDEIKHLILVAFFTIRTSYTLSDW